MTKLHLTGDSVVGGLTFDELDRMTRRGELYRVRRGAYEAAPAEPDPAERHRVLIEATLRQTPVQAVVSHESAAVIHGLPCFSDALSRVHLTRDRRGGGRVRRYVHMHSAPVPSSDVQVIDGWAVTSPARTVLDLGRTLPLQRAVAIGDAALAQGLLPDELAEVAARCLGWPGMAAARRAIELLDRRSESVGESASRVVIWEAGLSAPVPQLVVCDNGGKFVARCDFGWPQVRTLAEFDGLVKYGRLLKPGQSVGDILVEEKRREDALRDLGWQVVRWLWEDLRHPERLVERLERAFERGRGARY